MSITSAVEYSISVDDESSPVFMDNLDNKISFQKETKKGIKRISFDDAIISYSLKNNMVSMIIKTGTEDSARIDNIALTLAGQGSEGLYRFHIVKQNQFMIIDGALIDIK